ncbi:hypothetical protein [Tepidibacter sp. Z1-5]
MRSQLEYYEEFDKALKNLSDSKDEKIIQKICKDFDNGTKK